MQRDTVIFNLINQELERQRHGIELIASENFTSLQVMQAMGSVLTNKYAEGYPGRRYYGGCEIVDQTEQLAIDRLKEIFKNWNKKLAINKHVVHDRFSSYIRDSMSSYSVHQIKQSNCYFFCLLFIQSLIGFITS